MTLESMQTIDRNRVADAADKPRASGRSSNAKRRRGRPFDGRTREARAWRRHFADAMRQCSGRAPDLCRQVATLTCQREALDIAVAQGKAIDRLELVRIVGALNRSLDRLELVAPAEDATDQVVDALKRGMRS